MNRIDAETGDALHPVMPQEVRLWDRVSTPGFALAAGYVALVIASFAVGKRTPPDLGYEWLPFWLVTLPWSDLVQRLDVPGESLALIALLAGIVVNAVAIYLIGSLMQPMWVQFMNWYKNRDH